MDQEKIGKFIREIRQKEKLSQQKFAHKYGVTYQAVSKWETGKNIPDIAILKQMCTEYNMNLDDFLETKIPKKRYRKMICISIVFVVIIGLIWLFNRNDNDFEFKTLSSNCNNFKLYGSIAYNEIKSSIYISNITYCGGEDNQKYKKIKCTLYESNETFQKQISTFVSKENELMTLEKFLEDVKFHIDNYEKACTHYQENSLYLQIEATNEKEETITYKIPLTLKSNCN